MSTSSSVSGRRARPWRNPSPTDLLAILLVLLPMVTAIVLLVRTTINIPLEDDYQAIARFMTFYAARVGFYHKLTWVLTSQHNEYKLILLHAVVALQYELTGHTNYRFLQILGDLSAPATAILLWFFLARQDRPFKQAVWLFIAPCYLFLTISYWETLNFAMCGLSTMAIIPLALACIICYTSARRQMEFWGALLLAVTIATFIGGFFLAIVLILMLLYQRRYRSALGIVLISGAMAILYRVHYITNHPHPLNPAPRLTVFFYPVVFLGAAFTKIWLCTLLGLILIVTFVALVLRGWPRRSPRTFTLALFCVVTGLVVSAGRYPLGLSTAMSSRYSMYALLFVCAEYMAIIEMFVPTRLRRNTRASAAFALATILIMAWSLHKQLGAYHILQARHRLLATHLILWERHPDDLVLTPDEPGYMYDPSWTSWRMSCQPILQREISAGRYIPPVTASDELPVRPHSHSTEGIEDEQAPAD